jgi:hypothetical protein
VEEIKFWTDIYPHEIWTNILVLDNKVIDYKIGRSKRDKYTWTIRCSNREVFDRFDEVDVIQSVELVLNNIEHNQAFENGGELVDKYISNYGTYL